MIVNMRIITTNAPPSDPLGKLALYSGMDCLALYEINTALDAELMLAKRNTYEFEMDLQAALLEMSFNGCPVDLARRQMLSEQYNKKRKLFGNYLHQMCEAVGYYDFYKSHARKKYAVALEEDEELLPLSWKGWLDLPLATRKEWKKKDPTATVVFQKALKTFDAPFNADSPAQKIQLFYHFFGHSGNAISIALGLPTYHNRTRGITEHKTRNSNNVFTPSVDKEALDKILQQAEDDPRDAAYWATLFASCCLAITELTKDLGFLKCSLENGYFRSKYGAVLKTGRLNSGKNAQGYGSNAQNITPSLRSILTTPAGWKLATFDYEQIESRCVGAICFLLFGATTYLNATESGDLHSLACSLIWPALPWPENFNLRWLEQHGPFPEEMVLAARKIAEEPFYRKKSRRAISKVLGHGSNYLGKPTHLAKQTHIETQLVERYQQVYFPVFSEIPKWHAWVIEQIQTRGELTTPFGRVRQFFGRPSDDATIREAVAHSPQSMAADYTNTALLSIHKAILAGEIPAKLFLQKHDEIGVRYKEREEAIVIPLIRNHMVQTIKLSSPSGVTRNWHIPVDTQHGWNLGQWAKDNPDGLIKYRGVDKRSRQVIPPSAMETARKLIF